MWPFRSQSQTNSSLKLTIDGMHCVSCGLNIDGSLEETPGVKKSQTDYARGQTNVTYDASQVQPEQLISIIEKIGYKATPSR